MHRIREGPDCNHSRRTSSNGTARVQPLQVLVGRLHDVSEGDDRLNVRAGFIRRPQQSGTDVRIVGDGATDSLALNGSQDFVGTGFDNNHVGAGMHVSNAVGIIDGGHIPR